jgi:membrane protein DedA with SNARE-associated domain
MPTDVAGPQSRSARTRAREYAVEYGPLVLAGAFAILAVVSVAALLAGDGSMVEAFLAEYGLFALFGILVLEGAMLLYFAPSEALVPASIQLFAASTGDVATIVFLIVVATAGATVGQFALFTVAKRSGREWLLARSWFRVDERRVDQFEGWFDRWGRVAVALSNALLFTRGMLTVPAGFADMRDAEFLALSAVGTLVFQTWIALAWLGVLHFGL